MTMESKSLLLTGLIALGGVLPILAQEVTPTNVLLNKAVIEVAGNPAAESEGPEKLIDGDLQTKYCIIQSNPFVVIDALGYFQFSSFKFHDCATNEEEENASAYKIELSMDGTSWQTVAEASNVADVALKEIALSSPVKARYVRFSPTYERCARMWELEGFGVDATTLATQLQTESLELDINAESEIKVGFTITGEKGEDFACRATASKASVEVGTPVEADGVFTIPVKGISKGTATVEVIIVNNGEVAKFEIPVKVNSDAPISDADAVKVSNWTEDLIAESLEDGSFTSGVSAGWYSSIAPYSAAVQEDGAICDEDGIVEIPTSGNVYKIPVTENNARKLERNADPVRLTFEEAIPTEQVNMLVFADAEDGINVHATVIYDDNSESDPVEKTISYWEYEELDGQEALSGLGVVSKDYYDPISVSSEKNYRVYEMSIPTDQYKNAKEIELSVSGGSWGDVAYVIGVNAHNVNGVVTKHLNASLAEQLVKVKQDATANIVVNYTLTDVEGLTDELTYNAVASKDAITLGEIKHDVEAKTITIPVHGVTPALANVEITVAYGQQSMKLVAQVFVKSTVTASTEKCVEIANWANDVIAEANPASDHANQKLDDQGWVFFTDDVHPEGAIAGDERLIVANSGNVYELAPYTGNNATVIVGVGGYDVSRDITFVTPIYTETINLLATSANGEADLDITVKYEDGTNEDVQNAKVADWHASEADGTEAIYGLGRVNISSNDIAGERSFRLFEVPVTAKRNSKVQSVNINNKAIGTYLTVLGVNAKDEQTSGINSLTADKEGKTIVAYYNLQGQEVKNAANGLYIVRYADGTSAKLYIK